MEISLYKKPQTSRYQFRQLFSFFCEKTMDCQFLTILFHMRSLLSEIVKNMRQFIHTCSSAYRKTVLDIQHVSTMIDKVSLPFYNEGELGGVEMHPGLDKYMVRLRTESKERENQGKPPVTFYWPNERLTGMIGIS